MASPASFRTPFQVLYADDIIFFCIGTKRNVKNIIQLFDDYAKVS